MAASLTKGVLNFMFLFRLKIAVVVLAMTGLASTTMVLLAGSGQGEQRPSAPLDSAKDDVSLAPVISAIRFQGNDWISSEKIGGEISTRVGQLVDKDKIEADVRKLMKTFWFSDVRTHCQEKPRNSGKYVLTFFLRELPQIVPKVEYRGTRLIPLKDIEYLTDVKDGRPADRVRTALAVHQIQRIYLEKGYGLSTVTPRVEGYPGDLKVVIEIFEGPKQRLRSITFTGNDFATDGSLMAEISREQPTAVPVGDAQLRVHLIEERQNPIQYDLIDDDKQKMTKYYKDQGFLNVVVSSILREGDQPGDFHLVYTIKEGRRWPNVRPPHPNPLPKKGRGR